MTPIIALANVTKRFNAHPILEGVDLEILPGETITIIGGSGSGKSVTLKLILGLMRPEHGRIFFRGNDVTRMSEQALIAMRREIGMLFQGGALFDSLSVGENVAYPLREHQRDMPETEVQAIVGQRLALVGLPGIQAMMPSDLSGGMKKRVALARAIATNPAVILYDEPTTGLDPANTLRINRLIRECQRISTSGARISASGARISTSGAPGVGVSDSDPGAASTDQPLCGPRCPELCDGPASGRQTRITSIVVTHDMASAFMVTDRLALLYNRRIEFVGTVAEAKASRNPVVRNFIEGNMEMAEQGAR